MDRPESINYNSEMLAFKKELEEETGFVCYEVQPGDQVTFFGTSDKFDAFKTAVGDLLDTGTIAYLMDNCDSYMYSKYKDTWYPQQ